MKTEQIEKRYLSYEINLEIPKFVKLITLELTKRKFENNIAKGSPIQSKNFELIAKNNKILFYFSDI